MRAGLTAVGCMCAAWSSMAQPAFDPPQIVGVVNTSLLTESSGIAASRRTPGVLWTHNDSGDSARVFAIDSIGRHLGTYTLPSVTAVDFEDIAVGPGPIAGVHYLYIGDIGDNLGVRANVRVHRVPEPAVNLGAWASPVSAALADRVTITLTYPDGARDAEALFIDPISGDLAIVTKQASGARLYIASANAIASGGTAGLTYAGAVAFDRVTGGDISPDAALIVLRGLDTARVWERAAGQTMSQALSGTGVAAPVAGRPVEPQGEAIGFAHDGSGYFAISEGASPPLRFSTRRFCDADVNCDGAANGVDVEVMERAIGGDLADLCRADADFNGDGAANGLDVESVELAVGGGACP
ncbi:MAG: hypothetical protein HBSAPP03_20330 [Phycisphaerae bacterium]|nr:MAG: hypothetical protein HBSAPP03_20330 [Phycisphaerae bacterium]